MSKKVVCPYCFEELNRGNVRYFCPKCKKDVDPGYLDIFFNSIPKCGEKRHGVVNILCPNTKCKKSDNESTGLDSLIFDYKKNLSFSIIGTPKCGKTSFFIAMITKLKAEFSALPVGSDTTSIHSDYYKIFYDKLKVLDATKKGEIKPLWYKLRNDDDLYSLVFYDAAGEDNNLFLPGDSDADTESNENDLIRKGLSNPSNLIIMVDPNGFMEVANFTGEKADSSYIDLEYIINGLTQYIRRTSGLDSKQKIERNVAVVITKLDLIKDSDSFKSSILIDREMSTKNDYKKSIKENFDKIHKEIENWLKNMEGGKSLINVLESEFKTYRFFAVASRGLEQGDSSSEKIEDFKSFRILDPIMWFFSLEGIIKTDVR